MADHQPDLYDALDPLDQLDAHLDQLAVRLRRATSDARADDWLDTCRHLSLAVGDLDRALETAVEGARGTGASWQAIGAHMGVTRSGAFQRWAARLTRKT